ncbi:hypothetical protein LCGC14_1499750 [marine sediment metagenome]|uniref:Uncharacterized protein n=1 Tax=marine sediment metagenome TaxID=412755 RepID=A0A0F9LK30_9ZZZZ
MEQSIGAKKDITLTIKGTVGEPGIITDLLKLLDCSLYSLSIHKEEHCGPDSGWTTKRIEHLEGVVKELRGKLT